MAGTLPSASRRLPLPLGTKILLGLLLNLVLLAIGFAIVVAVQVRITPGWLLTGQAGERLQSLAELLSGELRTGSPGNAATVLERYREAYRLDFRLYDQTGTQLAGTEGDLPTEVRLVVTRPRGPMANRPGAGRGGGPPWAQDGAGGGRGRRLAGQTPAQARGGGAFPRTVARAGHPPAYWITVLLPPAGHPEPPLALVLRLDSLWSAGLLIDPRPWILAAVGALLVSGVFWYPLVRGITRDVQRMVTGTEEIAAGRFDHRLGLSRGDELGRLADAIDLMAGRLSGYVGGQKRFLGDAAHELCSPIARMLAALALLEDRDPSVDRRYVADLREDLDEMAALVHELLAFSRASHGQTVQLTSVNLRSIAEKAVSRETTGGATIINEIPEDLSARADASLLQRALANLVRNAVRYAAAAGPITLEARREPGFVRIAVGDQGPGVPEESLPRLFEPFYRPESSRSREFGGVGLGLAIVKTCIDACGGTVVARNRQPKGFEVVLTLAPTTMARDAAPEPPGSPSTP